MAVMDESLIAFIMMKHYFVTKLLILLSFDRILSRVEKEIERERERDAYSKQRRRVRSKRRIRENNSSRCSSSGVPQATRE